MMSVAEKTWKRAEKTWPNQADQVSCRVILPPIFANSTILFAPYSSSTNYVIYLDRGRKRKKDQPLTEVLKEAKELLARHQSGHGFAACSSRVAARKPRAHATYYFSKDSLTGRRKTHNKYRPRGPKAAVRVPRDDLSSHCADVDDNAGLEVEVPTISTETSDLESVLQDADKLLQDWRATKAPKQNWGQRSIVLNESWSAIRGSLLNTLISGHAVDMTSCMKCSENKAVIHCSSCHVHSRLCWHCDQLVHLIDPFHDRDALVDGFLKPIPPTVSMDCDGQWVSVDHLLPSSQTCLVCPVCSSHEIEMIGKQNHCIVVNLRDTSYISW